VSVLSPIRSETQHGDAHSAQAVPELYPDIKGTSRHISSAFIAVMRVSLASRACVEVASFTVVRVVSETDVVLPDGGTLHVYDTQALDGGKADLETP